MKKPVLSNLRQYCHWVALAVSLCILAIVVTLTIITPRQSFASDESSLAFDVFGSYQRPQNCGECHPKEFSQWAATRHAQATCDPLFQANQPLTDHPTECFACHTTGYDIDTGRFLLSGVTCEACHGPYQAGHQQQEATMVIDNSVDLCGTCHTQTLAAWQQSTHGNQESACIDCHKVHAVVPEK